MEWRTLHRQVSLLITHFTLVNLAPSAPIGLWATYEITIRNYSTQSAARMMGFFRRRRFLCSDGLEVNDPDFIG